MKKTLAVLLCACGTAVNVDGDSRPAPGKYAGSGAPLTSPCERALAGSTATEAFLIRPDGTKVTLVEVGANAWVGAPVVRGDFVALSVTRLENGAYVNQLLLFDRTGARLAVAQGGGQAWLSELGVAATWGDKGGLVLLRADGTVKELSGLQAAGDFGPGGLLPVWKGQYPERSLALLDVVSGQVTDVPVALAGWSAPIWAGDLLVYIGERDGSLVLVRQRGETTLVTPIIDVVPDFGGLAVEQVTATTAVLVTGSWVQVRTRLDLETGIVTPMEVQLPSGLTFAGRHSASLADDGSLIAALTENGAAGLFRSVDGKTWTSLGGKVAGATWVQFAGRQGSWLMTANGALGVTGATIGLVPSMGLTQVLPPTATGVPGAEALTEDGLCAAVWSGSGAKFTLTATDLVKGMQRRLLESAARPDGASWVR